MQHDVEAHLWDVIESVDLIERYCKDATLDTYLRDTFLQDAVERRLQIIGDALSKSVELSPVIAEAIPWVRQVIAFSNRLVHGYKTIGDQIVWEIIRTELPQLRAAVLPLLPSASV
jgi:uncharacterized protein with HEPN domain